MKKVSFYRSCPGRPFKIGAFDLETQGLGGALLLGTIMIEGGTPIVFRNDIITNMIDYMEEHSEHVFFAHNAQYDWRYFLGIFESFPDQYSFLLRNDNTVFQVVRKVNRGLEDEQEIIMRDSMAIWPGKLADLAESFCPDYPKLEIDVARFDPRNPEHVRYACRDVEILIVGLRRFNDIIFAKYDVNLSHTIASTAVKAWERTLVKGECYYNPKAHEDFIRSSYFGGIVFLTSRKEFRNVQAYDINSSYPAQMRKGVPYGAVTHTREIIEGSPGIYDVSVIAPDNLVVPVLPLRDISGHNPRVLWPSGCFRTTVTSIELEFAIECGYRIVTCHGGIVFEKLIYPFEKFVSKAETIRREFRGKPEEIVAKLIQNSLYGKFGSRRERRKLILDDGVNDISDCEPWGDESVFYVKQEHVEEMAVLPQWAVWVTANARIQLLRTVYELGVENVIYGDTDSIVTSGWLPTSKLYGHWKLEKEFDRFRAFAPKDYVGRLKVPLVHRVTGEVMWWLGAIKGLPRRATSFQDILELHHTQGIVAIPVEYLPSFMVSMKRGAGGTKHIVRRSSDIAKSANWYVDSQENVRAKPVEAALFATQPGLDGVRRRRISSG